MKIEVVKALDNKNWKEQKIPKNWEEHKNGHSKENENYPRITLPSDMLKIYDRVIGNRL